VALPLIAVFASFDYFITRNVIGAIFPLIVALAIPLGARLAGALGLIGSAALCSVFAVSSIGAATDPAVKKIDWRSAAAALGPPEHSRLIIVAAKSRPLLLYMRGVRPVKRRRPVIVSEIDVVAFNARARGHSGCWSGAACYAPRSFLRRAPVPGFDVTGRHTIGPLTLVRYRSGHPRPVLPRPLLTTLFKYPAPRQDDQAREHFQHLAREYFQPAGA
jgi:hypothetical protein